MKQEISIKQSFFKGVIVVLFVFVAQTIVTFGFPATANGWYILGLTALGTVLGYVAQSAAIPATSIFGNINLKDLIKGLLVSLSNFLSGWAATVIIDVPIDWVELAKNAGMMLILYVLKQVASNDGNAPFVNKN